MGGRGSNALPAYMKFHFTQAVGGIREQYSLERAQGKGDGFQKLTCASTALDSKSEKFSEVPNVVLCLCAQGEGEFLRTAP